MTSASIDIVLPYVDIEDPLWFHDFIETTGNYSPSPVRFRSWGTLRYLFRAIDIYLPFINKVFLLLARESQLPDWVNTDIVTVVYHKDFIPAEFLPTFNSCTIEAFLSKIPGLSEKFIYFNDDIFPINPLTADDFYTEDKPNLMFRYYPKYNCTNMFRQQCRNGLNMITDAIRAPRYPEGQLCVPMHSVTPMLLSTVTKVADLCKEPINKTISAIRQGKNVNQYIYSYYEFCLGHYTEYLIPYVYAELSDIENISSLLFSSELKMICMNDCPNIENYDKSMEQLVKSLSDKYPNPSKYEANL